MTGAMVTQRSLKIFKMNATRHTQILRMLNQRSPLSCAFITSIVAVNEKMEPGSNKRRYLSGSVSSTLAKMVKDNILEYAKTKTARGGHLYQIKK